MKIPNKIPLIMNISPEKAEVECVKLRETKVFKIFIRFKVKKKKIKKKKYKKLCFNKKMLFLIKQMKVILITIIHKIIIQLKGLLI